jgi:type I site-specific restriction endonuclease
MLSILTALSLSYHALVLQTDVSLEQILTVPLTWIKNGRGGGYLWASDLWKEGVKSSRLEVWRSEREAKRLCYRQPEREAKQLCYWRSEREAKMLLAVRKRSKNVIGGQK